MDSYRIDNLFSFLGLSKDSNKKSLDRVYNKKYTEYLVGKIDENEFILIEGAYNTLCKYFIELDEVRRQEKEDRKKMFLYHTYMMNKELEEIREIRLSERRFYQKITDIYATSIDYDSKAPTTIEFFKKYKIKCIMLLHIKLQLKSFIIEQTIQNKI